MEGSLESISHRSMENFTQSHLSVALKKIAKRDKKRLTRVLKNATNDILKQQLSRVESLLETYNDHDSDLSSSSWEVDAGNSNPITLDSEMTEENVEKTDIPKLNLSTQLAKWALKYSVPHETIDELLSILNPLQKSLPTDAQTLIDSLQPAGKDEECSTNTTADVTNLANASNLGDVSKPVIAPNTVTVTNPESSVEKMMQLVSGQLSQCLSILESHTERLIRIEQRLDMTSVIMPDESLLPPLPTNSIEELNILNTLMEENIAAKKAMTEYLSTVDGKDERTCTFRCLSRIFSLEFSVMCSWAGRKDNYPIKQLIITQILYEAVESRFPTTSQIVFENACKDWFRAANQRYTRAQKSTTDPIKIDSLHLEGNYEILP